MAGPAVEVDSVDLGSISRDSCRWQLAVVAGVAALLSSHWKMSLFGRDAARGKKMQPTHLEDVGLLNYVYQGAYPRQAGRFPASRIDVVVDGPRCVLEMSVETFAKTYHRLGHVLTSPADYPGRHLSKPLFPD